MKINCHVLRQIVLFDMGVLRLGRVVILDSVVRRSWNGARRVNVVKKRKKKKEKQPVQARMHDSFSQTVSLASARN